MLRRYNRHRNYYHQEIDSNTIENEVRSQLETCDKTDDINEFLSSLKLSSDAFYELTEKLKNRRPTVVVMVGDHGPNFGGVLKLKNSVDSYEVELAETLVPYVIWTNYTNVPEEYGEQASIEDLVPMALDLAGVPLSSYYDTILRLHDAVPLRNKYGTYIDANGNMGYYSPDSEYYDLINDYLYMEYNSLGDKEEIRRDLFLPN